MNGKRGAVSHVAAKKAIIPPYPFLHFKPWPFCNIGAGTFHWTADAATLTGPCVPGRSNQGTGHPRTRNRSKSGSMPEVNWAVFGPWAIDG